MTRDNHMARCACGLQFAAVAATDAGSTNDAEASLAQDLALEATTVAQAREPMAGGVQTSPWRRSALRPWRQRLRTVAAMLLLGAGACTPASDDSARATNRGDSATVMAASQTGEDTLRGDALTVTVYKTPTCGCCRAWVDHLRAEGFRVETVDRDDLTMVKAANGVPGELQSCHTATVGGYVVEGHVPAGDIRRLLAERPAVAGIAVPGMPVGSPGMEVPGTPADRYDVLSFDRAGATRTFASH